jgi:hypothetical protein
MIDLLKSISKYRVTGFECADMATCAKWSWKSALIFRHPGESREFRLTLRMRM